MEDQFDTIILATRFRFEVDWISRELRWRVSAELSAAVRLPKMTEAALVVWKQT